MYPELPCQGSENISYAIKTREKPGEERRASTCVVVKIMVRFLGTLNIRGHIIIGTQKRGHNFDNHSHEL